MSVTYINPRTSRHKLRAKRLFETCVDACDELSGEVAGFAVVVWNDSGYTAMGMHDGGPINGGAIPLYAQQKLNNLLVGS